MAYIVSTGIGIPEHDVTQEDVKVFVETLFPSNRRMEKLLPVFDNALVKRRQLAEDISFYGTSASFKEKNQAYQQHALRLSTEAADHCMKQASNIINIDYADIDALIFVSSSGISTPSMDAYLINERNFSEDIMRMPLWGLGCAGGAMGLSRGYEWLQANPDKTALVVACELCSLTFQEDDDSMSNLVATALFGDGASAALLAGETSSYHETLKEQQPKIRKTSSQLSKNTLDVMGWDVTNKGLEVIFSKDIPKLVPEMWKRHVIRFLKQENININEINKILAHPGGRKVLEAMQDTFDLSSGQLNDSYDVLADHGNMSSATVLYVVHRWLDREQDKRKSAEWALLCALGPGFSSELLLLERGSK